MHTCKLLQGGKDLIRITFIVPYASMKGTVEEIFSQHPERSVISQSVIMRTFDEIDTLNLDTDIVIARGYSANRIKKLGIPLIDMTVTGFDITTALNSCINRYRPEKIAIIGPLNTVYGIDEIKNVFPCCIEGYQVDDPVYLPETIDRVMQEGAEAVIAGRTGYYLCRDRGINSIMIESGRKTILQAIDEAVRSIRLMRRERERSDRFKSIMDYSFEGILSIDREGAVAVANNHALKVFPALEKAKNPLAVKKLLPQVDLSEVLRSGKKILGELVLIGKRMYTLNCAPAGDAGAVITFSNVTEIQEMEGKIRTKLHKKGLVAKYSFADIIGSGTAIGEAVRVARKFSQVESNIFIFGETGTGKELFAQSIHNDSRRRNQPFVAINCAALAEDLLESELFGYVDGAFTGASKGGKVGLFELAHRGTVFLDEIGDISPKLQSRLLRVLQEREIMRIGHDQVIPIDIRIISASNKDLKALVAEGKFREDLLYRLNVLKLTLPPLCARGRDIIDLCYHFIEQNRSRLHSGLRRLTPSAEQVILESGWPGNVRELYNFCERLCVLSEGDTADLKEVVSCMEQPAPSLRLQPQGISLAQVYETREKEAIEKALELSSSKKDAARLLGIDASTLWRKMKKHHL